MIEENIIKFGTELKLTKASQKSQLYTHTHIYIYKERERERGGTIAKGAPYFF